jgi:hypothetical protein
MQICPLIRNYDKEENKNTHDQYHIQAQKSKTGCACVTCLSESFVAAAAFLTIYL